MKEQRGADAIIMSRLLVLQSKRLLLNNALRRLARSSDDHNRNLAERLQREIDAAQSSYRASILAFESPERIEYWLVAYARLIDVGGALMARLRQAVPDLPAGERSAASADVEMLEAIIGTWTESMRSSMAAASKAVA